MKNAFILLTLLVAGGAVAAACGDSDDDGPTDPFEGRAYVIAPVDELELVIRESAPPQYAVRIVSGLPNGCAEFSDAQVVAQVDLQIAVRVQNSVPSDPNAVCTAIYGTHESTVELGSGFAPGAEYVVRVNDKELSFTAQ